MITLRSSARLTARDDIVVFHQLITSCNALLSDNAARSFASRGLLGSSITCVCAWNPVPLPLTEVEKRKPPAVVRYFETGGFSTGLSASFAGTTWGHLFWNHFDCTSFNKRAASRLVSEGSKLAQMNWWLGSWIHCHACQNTHTVRDF